MCLNPRLLFRPERAKRYIFVPCQKCVECKQRRSREWAFRLWYEYEACDKKAEMITLTYNEENLPYDDWNLPTLCKKDYQDFLKRLRKHFDNKKIRYFMCGEYGAKRLRPHFHFIIFGIKFDDKVYFKADSKGFSVYRSATLEKLWKKGFSSVSDFDFANCSYVSLYLQKASRGTEKYVKPFNQMSLKPGIGAGALNPKWLDTDKVYINGQYIRIPRYFMKLFERSDVPETLGKVEKIYYDRLIAADLFEPDLEAIDEKIKKIEKKFGKKLDINKML